jgi:hypothetical protein
MQGLAIQVHPSPSRPHYLTREGLDGGVHVRVGCTNRRADRPLIAETWSEANPEGRWRCYDYADLLKRDKLSLDLFWIKDKSLTDTDSLPAPGVIAAEIADDLEAALEQFTKIAARLK